MSSIVLRATAVAMLTGPLLATAQTSDTVQPPPGVRFEVASVKRNKSSERGSAIRAPLGRFTATNATLRQLVLIAYQLHPSQLISSPDWIDEERYDISATTSGAPPWAGPLQIDRSHPVMMMLRALLFERFQARMHSETKEMQVYALVRASRDGRLASQLKPSDVDCAALMRSRSAGQPLDVGGRLQCSLTVGPESIRGSSVGMEALAYSLSQRLDRIVIDRTQLSGNYDFEVALSGAGQQGVDQLSVGTFDSNAALLTALRDELGLKLEVMRAQVEVWVVESIERPSED